MDNIISIALAKASAGADGQQIWLNALDTDVVLTDYVPRFVPDTTVSTDASNYATITLASSKDDGTTWVALYSCTTNSSGGAALAVNVPTTMTAADAAGSAFRLEQGDMLRVEKTYTGTGAAVGGSVNLAVIKAP